MEWEPVPPGYVVGGFVTRSKAMGPELPPPVLAMPRVRQIAFIFGEAAAAWGFDRSQSEHSPLPCCPFPRTHTIDCAILFSTAEYLARGTLAGTPRVPSLTPSLLISATPYPAVPPDYGPSYVSPPPPPSPSPSPPPPSPSPSPSLPPPGPSPSPTSPSAAATSNNPPNGRGWGFGGGGSSDKLPIAAIIAPVSAFAAMILCCTIACICFSRRRRSPAALRQQQLEAIRQAQMALGQHGVFVVQQDGALGTHGVLGAHAVMGTTHLPTARQEWVSGGPAGFWGAYLSQQQGQQGQSTRTGQQGPHGGPGVADAGVGQQASGADEAVVVDAAFEALVAGLPAECEVPLVFLCPITQVGEGGGGTVGWGSEHRERACAS